MTELFELKQKWQCPMDLAVRPPPRRAKFTRGFWFLVIYLGVLFGFIAVMMSFVGLKQLKTSRETQEIFRDGTRAQALVIDRREYRGKHTSYYVTYDYVLGKLSYRRAANVSWNYYNSLAVGQKVDFVYLTANPAKSRLANETIPSDVFLLIPLIMPLLMLWLVPFIWTQGQKQMKILVDGQAGPALVSKSFTVKGGVSVAYSFSDGFGQTITGTSIVPSRAAPKVGDIVTVLYLPETPKKNLIYPPTYARLET